MTYKEFADILLENGFEGGKTELLGKVHLVYKKERDFFVFPAISPESKIDETHLKAYNRQLKWQGYEIKLS